MASLSSHLLDDLRPGADPHLAAIALHVAGPILRGFAEELEADCRLEPPAAVTVTLLGHRIELHPEGPDATSLAAAEASIVPGRHHATPPPVGRALLAVAGVVVWQGRCSAPRCSRRRAWPCWAWQAGGSGGGVRPANPTPLCGRADQPS